jgi:hypothetical protein
MQQLRCSRKSLKEQDFRTFPFLTSAHFHFSLGGRGYDILTLARSRFKKSSTFTDISALSIFGCLTIETLNLMTISSKSLRVARLLFAAILIAQVIAKKPVPWDPTTKLSEAETAAFEYYGFSVALIKNTAFVGSSDHDSNQGAVYVYQSNDNGKTWNQTRTSKLVASDRAADDRFGYSISAYNSTLLVGARGDDSDKGSAYVFSTNDGGATWNQVQKLVAGDGADDDRFACSVSMFKNLAVFGADEDDDVGTASGGAYVFKSNDYGLTWTQAAKLLAADGSGQAYFGRSVSIHENYILIGAPGDDSNQGAAYAYWTNDGGNSWLPSPKIVAFDGSDDQYYGKSVSIFNQVALIGAKNRAYVYRTTDGGGTWGFVTKLVGSGSVDGDDFGNSVFLQGTFGYEYALVGAYNADTSQGAAYMFQSGDGGKTWVQASKLVASDRGGVAGFGHSLTIFEDNALIGAYVDSGYRRSCLHFRTMQQKLSPREGESRPGV